MTFDLHLWPLTSWTCEGSYISSINQLWFQWNFNFSNEANFTFWAHLTAWHLMTFDLGKLPLTTWTYKGSYNVSITNFGSIGLQLLKWATFTFSALSYNLTSDDLWPWYLTSDLTNKWGFPCCIYEPNFGWNPSQHVEGRDKCYPVFTTNNNNRHQQWTKWSLCVFPAKAGNTKLVKRSLFCSRPRTAGNAFRGLKCHSLGKRGAFVKIYSNSSDSNLFRG